MYTYFAKREVQYEESRTLSDIGSSRRNVHGTGICGLRLRKIDLLVPEAVQCVPKAMRDMHDTMQFDLSADS